MGFASVLLEGVGPAAQQNLRLRAGIGEINDQLWFEPAGGRIIARVRGEPTAKFDGDYRMRYNDVVAAACGSSEGVEIAGGAP